MMIFKKIVRMLEDKGFKRVVWERKKDMPKYPNEVYALLEKKIGDKPYYIVAVYLYYTKDMPNSVAHNFKIDVHNVYKGMTITELKDEIDKIGDSVYQELVDKVGKEKVLIERKEIHHRIIFF